LESHSLLPAAAWKKQPGPIRRQARAPRTGSFIRAHAKGHSPYISIRRQPASSGSGLSKKVKYRSIILHVEERKVKESAVPFKISVAGV